MNCPDSQISEKAKSKDKISLAKLIEAHGLAEKPA